MYARIKKLTPEESAQAYGHKYAVEKYHSAGCKPTYYFFMKLEDAQEYANRINE